MSGSTHRRNPTIHSKGKPAPLLFELPTARRMLPLVRQIVHELGGLRQTLVELSAECERLDRVRRTLDWPARRRRYQTHEEVTLLGKRYQEAVTELEGLGIVVLDHDRQTLGFPTIVNQRTAYFVWCPAEKDVEHWKFAGTSRVRQIPPEWSELPDSPSR